MRYEHRVDCVVSGKIQYSRDEAQRAVARLLFQEQDEQNAGNLRAYKCRDCHRWHIGHSKWARMGVES